MLGKSKFWKIKILENQNFGKSKFWKIKILENRNFDCKIKISSSKIKISTQNQNFVFKNQNFVFKNQNFVFKNQNFDFKIKISTSKSNIPFSIFLTSSSVYTIFYFLFILHPSVYTIFYIHFLFSSLVDHSESGSLHPDPSWVVNAKAMFLLLIFFQFNFHSFHCRSRRASISPFQSSVVVITLKFWFLSRNFGFKSKFWFWGRKFGF